MTSVAQHTNPVWGHKSNFLIQVDLAPFGMKERWEQLWVRQLGEGSFEVCCIPFFTYGVALGDTVSAVVGERFDYEFRGVIAKSGQLTLRIAVVNRDDATRLHEHIHAVLSSTGLAHEWYGTGYVAVSVSDDADEGAITSALAAIIDRGEVAIEVDRS